MRAKIGMCIFSRLPLPTEPLSMMRQKCPHLRLFKFAELVSGAGSLGEYRFNTGVAEHLFCTRCGVKSFYHPRSHRDAVNVNARCLDHGTVQEMLIRPVNGARARSPGPVSGAPTRRAASSS